MLWIANGLAYVFMKGEVIYGLPAAFRSIGTGYRRPDPGADPDHAGRRCSSCTSSCIARRLGVGIYAIGGNPVAARLSGMPVQRRLVIVYALSGLMASFAGLIVIARTNAADVSLGEEQLLPAIAAVCLGGTSLFGGVGGVAGTAVGVADPGARPQRHEPARRQDILAGRRARASSFSCRCSPTRWSAGGSTEHPREWRDWQLTVSEGGNHEDHHGRRFCNRRRRARTAPPPPARCPRRRSRRARSRPSRSSSRT